MAGSNSTKPPSYRLHKASGQAVVTINRRDHRGVAAPSL